MRPFQDMTFSRTRFKRKFLALFLVVLFSSCGFPSETQVKEDFKVANPTFQPLSAVVGEGHGDAAYYHIRYKKPDDAQTYEQVWLYLRDKDSRIKLTNRERETVVK